MFPCDRAYGTISTTSAHCVFCYKFIATAIVAIGIVTNEISSSHDRVQR